MSPSPAKGSKVRDSFREIHMLIVHIYNLLGWWFFIFRMAGQDIVDFYTRWMRFQYNSINGSSEKHIKNIDK